MPALQESIRKKLGDAKVERERSQNNEDIRALRDEIAELRSAAHDLCYAIWLCHLHLTALPGTVACPHNICTDLVCRSIKSMRSLMLLVIM